MTATRRPRPGQVLTVRAPGAPRPAARERRADARVGSHYRSARAPRPRPRIQAPAASGTRPATAADRADLAA